MKATDFEQLVLHPDDHKEENLRSYVEQWIDENPPKPIPLRARAVLLFGWLIHPIGHHTWVTWRQWDPASHRFVDVGEKCRYCPKGRLT